jgi:TonB family protein
MRKTILCFLLFSKIVFGQEMPTIKYLDSLGKPASKETFFKYEIFKKENVNIDKYILQTFDKGNNLIYSYTYSDENEKNLNGEASFYYTNGNKKSSINYVDNRPIGNAFKWYENGNPKQESVYLEVTWASSKYEKIINFWNEKGEKTVDNGDGLLESKDDYLTEKGYYKNGYKDGKWIGNSLTNTFSYEENYSEGELVSGISFESDGTKNEYTSLEVKPAPVKGMSHFYKYISNNFNAPNSAYKNKIQGKIIVTFVVDKEGKIVEPKITRSLGNELDDEAIRILTSYENWKPALQKGRKVRCSFTIPIQLDFTR